MVEYWAAFPTRPRPSRGGGKFTPAGVSLFQGGEFGWALNISPRAHGDFGAEYQPNYQFADANRGNWTMSVVPLPDTLVLLAGGMAVLCGVAWWRHPTHILGVGLTSCHMF